MNARTPTPWLVHVVKGVGNYRAIVNDAHTIVIATRCNETDAAHIVRCVNAWDDAEALRARLAEVDESFGLAEASRRAQARAS